MHLKIQVVNSRLWCRNPFRAVGFDYLSLCVCALITFHLGSPPDIYFDPRGVNIPILEKYCIPLCRFFLWSSTAADHLFCHIIIKFSPSKQMTFERTSCQKKRKRLSITCTYKIQNYKNNSNNNSRHCTRC